MKDKEIKNLMIVNSFQQPDKALPSININNPKTREQVQNLLGMISERQRLQQQQKIGINLIVNAQQINGGRSRKVLAPSLNNQLTLDNTTINDNQSVESNSASSNNMDRMMKIYNRYISPDKKAKSSFQTQNNSVIQASFLDITTAPDNKRMIEFLKKDVGPINALKVKKSRNFNNQISFKTQQQVQSLQDRHRSLGQHFAPLEKDTNMNQILRKYFTNENNPIKHSNFIYFDNSTSTNHKSEYQLPKTQFKQYISSKNQLRNELDSQMSTVSNNTLQIDINETQNRVINKLEQRNLNVMMKLVPKINNSRSNNDTQQINRSIQKNQFGNSSKQLQ
ncbi:UNKNOWN [Stylonychia lemnae]|uniref:Uncharacterized protein n=1 Tax=Stylonychia lemnae TaxID=5949 RepID=A0A078B9A7_STYLE|nr:UNKNOWN [Stylonychia lemnae]|eukprot:CDW90153.1 UNKNOWN [Stylonychia lemnae]